LKKLIILLLATFLPVCSAIAAGTCDVVTTRFVKSKITVTVTCTADAADGSFPDTSFGANTNNILQRKGNYWLINVQVTPGTTGPTADSDLQLLNADDYDVLGGAGTDNVDTATTNEFYPENTSGDLRYYPVVSDLTQVLSNNAVNSAEITITYFFSE
jgi:hypothetical protein